ncbi:MAG: L-lactate permease [Archaeoglobaceae archaeon]
MELVTLALVAVAPIVVVLVLMAGLRMSAMKAMPIGWFLTVLIAYFFWGVKANWIAGATIKGFLNALDIMLVVFGAIFLYYNAKMSGILGSITESIAKVSKDRRIQAGLAFLLGAFFEGAAGFGTPGAIVGPLLVGIGFPPLIAAALVLIYNSSPVSFGCVGIPVWGGLGASLDNPVVHATLAEYGYTLKDFLYKDITLLTATLHGVLAVFVPLLGVTFMVKWGGGKLKDVKDVVPTLLLAGICFAVPYWTIAKFLGPEFPSLLGAAIGLLIYVLLLKKGFGVPKRIWEFSEKYEAKEEFVGKKFGFLAAILPYVLVALGLVVTRVVPEINSFVNNVGVIVVSNILDTNLSQSYKLLYNPGSIFIIAVLISNLILKVDTKTTLESLKVSLKAVAPAAIALMFAIGFSQIMMTSGNNIYSYPSMLRAMAEALASATGPAYILVAAFVGVIGAYMAGSNTVSNIMFGGFQFEAASFAGYPKSIIVALQNVGGAAGNMICVHNIVAVCTTVGILGKEGVILRRNLLPCAIYGIAAGIIAVVLLALGIPKI